ncbi:MAG: 4-hydroxybenzoate octaprenyltransferase [Thiotrichaceae bacterium]|nr:4-hydroxybenzoate octaprenyltransferase [Thiotrichaceae bacterium]
MISKLKYYSQLMRLDRPIGIYLLLWPTLWALLLAAEGAPDFKVLVIFILGVIVMRSAGCVINDFADRNIDGQVQRTKDRPLASGKVTSKEALLLFAGLAVIALILVLQLNTLTIQLSFVALVLAVTYPFMKRFHSLPQLHLGMAFAWAIPMAYSAVTNELPSLQGWLVFVATVLWTLAYDTMYALADKPDDVKIGVKSSAILFGDQSRLIIGLLQFSVLVILMIIGYLGSLSWLYYLSLLGVVSFMLYQQALLAKSEFENGLAAFLNNHLLGLTVFIGIALHFVY